MKFVVVALLGLAAVSAAPQGLTGQALVDFINANTKLWTASNKEVVPRYKLMKSEYIKVPEHFPEAEEIQIKDDVPDTFDARQQWPQCVSIGGIRDQSDCGSCWAFAAAESITDRTCIAKNQTVDDILSADDILSCCGFSCGDGCEGGYPIKAWSFWVHKGVCTGSSFLSQAGCKPYPIAPCGDHNGTYHKKCPDDEYPTPKCENSCQAGYPLTYSADKHYGASAYKVKKNVAAIQKEIYTNGPVEAAYTVYEDFYKYTGGVYHHVSGGELGGHAVKILGWGTEAGTPYWLVANSWDTDWGESGFFKIRRGTDECGIEDGIVAGLPKV